MQKPHNPMHREQQRQHTTREKAADMNYDKFAPNMGGWEDPQVLVQGQNLTPKRLTIPKPEEPDDPPTPEFGGTIGGDPARRRKPKTK